MRKKKFNSGCTCLRLSSCFFVSERRFRTGCIKCKSKKTRGGGGGGVRREVGGGGGLLTRMGGGEGI